MIREMQVQDKENYIEMTTAFYSTPAVSHKVPNAVFVANFKEMTETKQFLEGYIFEFEDKIAGFVVVSKMFETEVGGLCLWIEDIYIKPEFRSKGLGKEFFDFIQKKYMWKAKRLRLEVSKGNVRAKELYRKCGFEELPYEQMIKEL